MMTLKPEDFPAFFHAVHGVAPFPWQTRLAAQVTAGGWVADLDIPTGCGKTATMDVAVFALALEAHLSIDLRRAPVRTAFIVDRRLVVDDAYQRACKLAEALGAATGYSVVARVASRLRLLAGETNPPLATARLRGGMPREPDWARTPTQPTVLISTVDQVGSRLLFRGYGISNSMKPVHAGLLGRDTLLLLDEAHLSQPFLQTVRDIGSPPWPGTLAASPFHVVSMTATPTGSGYFRLDDADRADTTLTKRLAASKPVTLEAKKPDALVAAFVQHARRLSIAGGGSAQATAIVVNRVAMARAIFDALKSEIANGLAADAALLIGRTRDVDRDVVLSELLPRMRAGRDQDGPPLFVVATQCIEAGADLDFDAMVTELAPLDCLRQRFGRLNRLGRHAIAYAAILAGTDQIGSLSDNPIYGDAMRETWQFLKQLGGESVDFGLNAAAAWMPGGQILDGLIAPRANAPLLLPRDAHAWACTSPIPAVDPFLPLYLHGPDASPGDVQIIWRKELDAAAPADWAERIAACPPVSGEAISLPIGEARRWIDGTAKGEIADVEGRDGNDDAVGIKRRFLIWREGEVRWDTSLRPGDTIVVATTAGGADRWGWNPLGCDPVKDVGDAAMLRAGRRRILRIIPSLNIDAVTLNAYNEQSDRAVLADLLEKGLLEKPRGIVVRSESDNMPIAVVLAPPDAASEDDVSSLAASRPRRLTTHTDGVVEMIRQFCERLGLPDRLREDMLLAARLHDAGKAHPAFQCYLYGGDELAMIGGNVLAKSGRLLGREDRRRAGLPDAARHEVASLRLAEAHPEFATANDPELVLWLIGTHHGHGRPLFPAVAWPVADDVFDADLGGGGAVVRSKPALSTPALTARWLALHGAVHRRYGPWWLAHAEAVLRLADHRQSEKEAREE